MKYQNLYYKVCKFRFYR